mgnify:CR=1 FL=1
MEPEPGPAPPGGHRSRLKKILLTGLGFLCVTLGVIGIVLPLVPTTFPLLLAAALFARSSERFLRWLLHHRLFGTYIRNYREGRGMTRRHKITTLLTLWVGIALSIYFSRSAVIAIVVLVIVLIGVTIHIVMLPTAGLDDGRDPSAAER